MRQRFDVTSTPVQGLARHIATCGLKVRIVACLALQPALKDSPMYILRAFGFLLLLAQAILAQQPTPILSFLTRS
jgi:hypothetical protein